MDVKNILGLNKKIQSEYNRGVASMPENKNLINALTDRLIEVLSQRVEKEVPQNGKFSPISVSYTIPDTQNKAKVAIEYDALEPKNTRRLSISSFRMGSDRLFTTYILKGTKQEILDYISKPEFHSEVIQKAKHLSAKVDDYYLENF